MDFGLFVPNASQTFLRYRPEIEGYVLHRTKTDFDVVPRLLLHIDFPNAEDDETLGDAARGTGVLQFYPKSPPSIVCRLENCAPNVDPNSVGFVFDVASPYPIEGISEKGLPANRFSSTYIGAKMSFHEAYGQYRQATQEMVPGYPVFDTYQWIRCTVDTSTFRPILQLVGYVADMNTPLPVEALQAINAKRDHFLKMHAAANRPRLVRRETVNS